jgi:glycine/D-amino acid oxidase-like deaminating enzyme
MPSSEHLGDARIVVIGAGVIGAVLAYRLAQAGARVTVVERRHPGAGTTGATFAYVNGTDKPPRPYHRLSALSIRDHEDLADELGGRWMQVSGSLHWADPRDGARTAALDGVMHRLAGWGMRVDRLAPARVVAELEPDLAVDPEAAGPVYLVHRAGWLDPMALTHAALSAAVERYGGSLVRGEVTGFRAASGLLEAAVLDDGREVPADLVINAAGPDSGTIAALAGTRLPVERSPGILIVSAPAPVRLRHVVYAPEVNVRPEGGSRILVQREPLDGEADPARPPAPGDPRITDAMGHAAALLPGLAGVRVEAVRVGVRPMPRDGFPIVGFDPSVGNLYHVVTHSGITLAARLALLVTEELTGGDAAPLDAYRPARFNGVSRVPAGHGPWD